MQGGYNGHFFQSKKGDMHRALVEFAPYQPFPKAKRLPPPAKPGTPAAAADGSAAAPVVGPTAPVASSQVVQGSGDGGDGGGGDGGGGDGGGGGGGTEAAPSTDGDGEAAAEGSGGGSDGGGGGTEAAPSTDGDGEAVADGSGEADVDVEDPLAPPKVVQAKKEPGPKSCGPHRDRPDKLAGTIEDDPMFLAFKLEFEKVPEAVRGVESMYDQIVAAKAAVGETEATPLQKAIQAVRAVKRAAKEKVRLEKANKKKLVATKKAVLKKMTKKFLGKKNPKTGQPYSKAHVTQMAAASYRKQMNAINPKMMKGISLAKRSDGDESWRKTGDNPWGAKKDIPKPAVASATSNSGGGRSGGVGGGSEGGAGGAAARDRKSGG